MRRIMVIMLIFIMYGAVAAPLETTISYQGELIESGVLANGDYDFEFRLFDVVSGGSEIASTITVDGLAVTDGVFTALIDFGSAPYDGTQLWLQIGVRPGVSVAAYDTLLPRQKVTAAPYALYAEGVALNAIGSSQIDNGSVAAVDVDSSQIQFRVVGSCSAGSSIRSISASGSVVCEDDTGLDLSGVLCPAEQVMVGFKGNGQPECTSVGNVAGACPVSTPVELVTPGKIDIILLTDNSSSMVGELDTMEGALNGMAATLDALNSDYRFILVNDHGSGTLEMCIPPPLSGTVNCAGPAVSGPRFFHYDYRVLSHDSLCVMLDAFAGAKADESGFFDSGYQSLLRPAAYKAFVELSDDGVSCTSTETGFLFNDLDTAPGGQTAATTFDTALLALSPENFGTSAQPRYGLFGIIGVPDNGSPTTPYTSANAISTTTCGGAVDPGTGYQALARDTQALWFSQCSTASYASMLDQIAVAANDYGGASSTCMVNVDIPATRSLDQGSASLVYTPGGGGTVVNLDQVANSGACVSDDFYFAAATALTLCPTICATIHADNNAALQLDINCNWPP